MKKDIDNNDIFLSDWLAGKLSDEQLRNIVSDADFSAYLQLRESLESFQIPEPEMDANFNAVKQKLAFKKDVSPVKVIPIFKYALIAAAIALIFGLYQFFIFSDANVMGVAQIETVIMDDDSSVTLNSKTSIYYPSLFAYNRQLELEGEAYFQVKKGSAFTVKTESGNVEVLGTKFNVISKNKFFEVICYEGKVKVSSNGKSSILHAGEALRYLNGKIETWIVEDHQPLWLSGESGFRNVPLYFVIDQFRTKYNLKVEYPLKYSDVRFTGTFTNSNIDTALKSICIPLNLKYQITKERNITISE